MSNRELSRIAAQPIGCVENLEQFGGAERLGTSVRNVPLVTRQVTALFV